MTPPLCPRLCPQKNPSKKKGAGVSANPLDLFVGAAGFEASSRSARTRSFPLTDPLVPAHREPVYERVSVRPRSPTASCDPLPSPLPEIVRAAGVVAAAAVERGDLSAARRALEEGLRALESAAPAPLRIVRQ